MNLLKKAVVLAAILVFLGSSWAHAVPEPISTAYTGLWQPADSTIFEFYIARDNTWYLYNNAHEYMRAIPSTTSFSSLVIDFDAATHRLRSEATGETLQLSSDNSFGIGYSNVTISDFSQLVTDNFIYPLFTNTYNFYTSAGSTSPKMVMHDIKPSAVPIPGAIWLIGAGLAGLAGVRKKIQA